MSLATLLVEPIPDEDRDSENPELKIKGESVPDAGLG